jgi:hypothetical protein
MRRTWGILATALLCVLPLAASAAHATAGAGYGTIPPVPGKWVIIGYGQGMPPMAKGHFVVTAHHKSVRGFTATPSRDFTDNCGSDPVSVVGAPPITHYQGVNHYNLHFSVWMVGQPAGDGAVDQTKVTVSVAGQHIPGTLLLAFENPRGGRELTGPPKSMGALTYKLRGHSQCGLSFLFKKS